MRGLSRRRFGNLAALALSVGIGACTLLPPTEGVLTPRPLRSAIEAYTLSGRISARQGELRYSANIVWQHDPSRDDILLSTPLGQGVAELTRDATGARLITSDRREFAAPDWEVLSARVFGFALPLTALPRWVVADAPGVAARDAADRPLHFSDDGWAVAYRDYESVAAYALPQSIEIKRGDIEVRLKIDEWQAVR